MSKKPDGFFTDKNGIVHPIMPKGSKRKPSSANRQQHNGTPKRPDGWYKGHDDEDRHNGPKPTEIALSDDTGFDVNPTDAVNPSDKPVLKGRITNDPPRPGWGELVKQALKSVPFRKLAAGLLISGDDVAKALRDLEAHTGDRDTAQQMVRAMLTDTVQERLTERQPGRVVTANDATAVIDRLYGDWLTPQGGPAMPHDNRLTRANWINQSLDRLPRVKGHVFLHGQLVPEDAVWQRLNQLYDEMEPRPLQPPSSPQQGLKNSLKRDMIDTMLPQDTAVVWHDVPTTPDVAAFALGQEVAPVLTPKDPVVPFHLPDDNPLFIETPGGYMANPEAYKALDTYRDGYFPDIKKRARNRYVLYQWLKTHHIPDYALPSVPPKPEVADIRKNIQASIEAVYSKQHNLPFWFKSMVETGGEWDYKRLNRTRYENFGNFHFGIVGAAIGFPLDLLLRGAGFYQWVSGTTKPAYGWAGGDPPYGDDPRDQEQIIRGYLYYLALEDYANRDEEAMP
jgi:hypothetical protein